jgi:hypothetical protein
MDSIIPNLYDSIFDHARASYFLLSLLHKKRSKTAYLSIKCAIIVFNTKGRSAIAKKEA